VHCGRRGRGLARSMTDVSGIGDLLPDGAVIDDWAFEPCGYSMNASHEQHYYTIHITPELAFSYASFETNDPAYRKPEHVATVVRVFSPGSLTLTLTTRGAMQDALVLPRYSLPGLHCASHEHHALTRAVSVYCMSYAKDDVADVMAVAKPAACSDVRRCERSEAHEGSEASDDTTSSDETLPVGEAIEVGEVGEVGEG